MSIAPRSPYLNVDEVATMLGRTPRTIRELCRTFAIPHFKLAGGSSPCLFKPDELDAWIDGAELEIVKPAGHPGRSSCGRPRGGTRRTQDPLGDRRRHIPPWYARSWLQACSGSSLRADAVARITATHRA